MPREYKIGVLGATGAVGREILNCLSERAFPFSEVRAFASSRSVGSVLDFDGGELTVEEVNEDSFKGLDLAIFAAGSGTSAKYAPIAAKSACPVVDNSSYWRMDERVPLIVPEVNAADLANHKGIIANPNCSTIQMVVALKPIYDEVGIKRIIVSTYQAVSGTGQQAIEELASQTSQIFNCQEVESKVYPHRIAFNCIPHIDSFTENAYTKEEMKMVNESKKIFADNNIQISATCVRVPVFYGHSEAIWVETDSHIDVAEAKKLLKEAPGILLFDEPENNKYPMPIDSAGRDEVFVGRVRADISCENGLALWVVADNLRKGAACNAVEIAELMIRDQKLLKTNWNW